jgi:hypothetical protein
MKNLLIVLAGEPLTPYYFKKFSTLRKKNKKLKVKFWYILPIISKKIANKYYPAGQHTILKNKDFINIDNFSLLKKELKKLPKSFYFFNSSPKLIFSLLIEKFISLKGGQKISIQLGGIPLVNSSFFQTVKFRLLNFNFVSIIKILLIPSNFLTNIIKKSLETKPSIFFVPNKYWYELRKKNNKISKIKKINDHEYEVFKKLRKLPRKKNQIIFIDEMKDSPMDHDCYWNYPKSLEINSEYYWDRINSFLDIVHEQTRINPVIAAAHRRKKDDIPINKKFIFNKTPELIKDAKLVLSHSSTAIHYAVLFKKPIILLNINEFEKKQTSILHVRKFQQLLGCAVVKIEEILEKFDKFKVEKYLTVNHKKYENFIDNFLRFKDSKEFGVWEKISLELSKNKND